MSYPSPENLRVTLSARADYDAWIDVRSPAEFAEDHLPGAVNLPVLSDAERHEVGVLYATSPFEARKLGAIYVADNIARMLADLRGKPKGWKPLVYCWRGGMRSQSAALWLCLVGFRAGQLQDGYKAWRRHVVAALATLPQTFSWRVICGPTGSAKTRLLFALAEAGEQTLDLEGLAAHKGSVLGALPGREQPSQKWFESQLVARLETFDPARPVYVEAESRKIGKIALGNALIEALRVAPCIEIQATPNARLAYLLEDYAYLGDDPERLIAQLNRLQGLVDNDTLARWRQWASARALPELFRDLMEKHYDPKYARSQYRHFVQLANARRLVAEDLSARAIGALARQVTEVRACS